MVEGHLMSMVQIFSQNNEKFEHGNLFCQELEKNRELEGYKKKERKEKDLKAGITNNLNLGLVLKT